MSENFRQERIKKLIEELRYEISRAYHERDISYEWLMGIRCEFIVGVLEGTPTRLSIDVRPDPMLETFYDPSDKRASILKLVKDE